MLLLAFLPLLSFRPYAILSSMGKSPLTEVPSLNYFFLRRFLGLVRNRNLAYVIIPGFSSFKTQFSSSIFCSGSTSYGIFPTITVPASLRRWSRHLVLISLRSQNTLSWSNSRSETAVKSCRVSFLHILFLNFIINYNSHCVFLSLFCSLFSDI